MPDLLVRAQEGCAPDPFLLWDSVHKSIEDGTDFVCDWALAGPAATLNAGGLQATAALGTAVYLLLFTDVYCPPDHPLYFLVGGDNRGWWGDGIDLRADLGEQPLGSLLWLLERAPLVCAGVPTATWAQLLASAALAPLSAQGVVAAIDMQASANIAMERIELSVQLYGRDGAVAYSGKYNVIWRQI
jgi:phage gp46-like protein